MGLVLAFSRSLSGGAREVSLTSRVAGRKEARAEEASCHIPTMTTVLWSWELRCWDPCLHGIHYCDSRWAGRPCAGPQGRKHRHRQRPVWDGTPLNRTEMEGHIS